MNEIETERSAEPRTSLTRTGSFQAHRSHTRAPPSLDFSDSSSGSSSDSEESVACLKTAQPRNMAAHPGQLQQDLIISPNSVKSQSPCFVHSHLADHAYTNDKKSAARLKSPLPDTHDTLAHLVDGKALHTPTGRRPSFADVLTKAAQDDADSDGEGSQTEEGESDEGSSLTRKLAETAVSVREMSKQLGRALVKTNVNSILIITKARDNQLIKLTREMAIWIMTSMKGGRERGVVVYVDAQLKKSKRFDAAGIERDHPQLFKPFFRRFSRRNSSSSLSSELSELKRHGSLKTPRTVPPSPSRSHSDLHDEEGLGQGQLRYWTPAMCTKSPHLFDFVITLGGDGTVLFASWLFQRVVPPILPFALGSLGFLTCFDFSNFRTVLNTVVNQGVRVNLRMRFTCTVFRAVEVPETQRRAMRSGKTGEIYMADLESGDWDAIESGGNIKNRGSSENLDKDREVLCFSTRPVEEFEVINDLVVDRGPSPYVSLLELFGDEHHMTTVQADGLCIATPTGSTAYSLSAGGSLVSPESPAILVTPICPHTLSFRPILLPDSMELRICVPYNSRSTAWASFDGRGRVELRQGDHIRVRASSFPFPTVCRDKQSTDWFHSIARTLKWNERQRQKSFVVVEEERKEAPDVNASRQAAAIGAQATASSVGPLTPDPQYGEDEAYDIDDLSGAESAPPSPPPKIRHPPRESSTASSASTASSLTDSDSRFAEPVPHPPKLSHRHSNQKAAGSSTSRSRSSTATKADGVPPIREGETGDRDHLLDRTPLEKRRLPRHLRLTPAVPAPAPAANGDSDKLEKRRSETAPAHRRAFAIYGEDESDTSVSDLSEG